MSKVIFNNKNYSIDDSAFAPHSNALKQHFSGAMNGSGAAINFGGSVYNIDSAKLAAAKNALIAHLTNISGNGYKVVIGGVEYGVDATKVVKAVAEIEAVLNGSISGGDGGSGSKQYVAGLYQTGAIALYNEQGAEAIEGMMIKSWDELVASGVVSVNDGVVDTRLDDDWVNESSEMLAGDLFLPNDGSITAIGHVYYDEDENEFGEYWGFNACEELTGVVLPDTVDFIGAYAFSYCVKLTTVNIPDAVRYIGDYAFERCDLTNIVIPNGVNSISNGTFAGCKNLTSVVIPNSVVSIGHYAFSNCNLTNIEIPNSVNYIGQSVFENCTIGITFDGSVSQWNSISKNDYWDNYATITSIKYSY